VNVESPTGDCLLRIYHGEDDRCDGRPLHEAIVHAARAFGLAGATVLKGSMGYGHASRIHTAKLLRLSEDLPIIVEIVDRWERIDAFLPELDTIMTDGIVTLERVAVIRYRGGQKEPA
jgi:PII-like signaling protein